MDKYNKKLEYYKVLEMLNSKASFAVSKEYVENLEPYKDIHKAAEAMATTSEAVEILRLYPLFSVGGARDIREALKRGELGGVMDIAQLIAVADTARASRQNKEFFSQLKGNFPNLSNIVKNLGLFKTIETAVEKALTPEGAVADSASDRLYNIRHRIRMYKDQIQTRLDAMIKNPATAKYLQEPIVTIRGDRFVVPVKQEYKGSVAGVVHDISSSGSTLFIEPMVVVDANNELSRLHLEEADEIAAILRALTAVVISFREELDSSLYALAKLDFALAKARLAYDMTAAPCKLNQHGVINLKQARHPLIVGKAVPIDVDLNQKLQTMVITGPNTGGKTVTLKTIGLLTLMAASGLHIPAEVGSELGFFNKIYADIGDEQSIEQSLSTFSAHMTNIVYILNNADENSLVLMDELGSGTDPTEGAALAMSILEFLFRNGTKVVATTHYSELKSFAYNKAGYINASVEFDVETLSPTYRLLMGTPGKSNAFEISRKLGLQGEIIDRANSFLSQDEQQVAQLITGLEEHKQQAELAAHEAELRLAGILEQERRFKDKEIELHNREADILRKAKMEAAAIVKKTRIESEALYEKMKEDLKKSDVHSKDVQANRKRIKNLEERANNNMPSDKFGGDELTKVKVGQKVEIPKLRQRGIVLSEPDNKKDVLVQIGVMKITVKLADLRVDTKKDQEENTKYNKQFVMKKAKHISPEIDLRGAMVDEAIEELDKYLDDCFLANVKMVRVIHGKGTGALKAGLTPYLQKHRLVESTKMGEFGEGGHGVTVVTLK